MTSVEQRVALGAALLDEHGPGWANEIDVDTLHLCHCDRCVLGQIFGSFQSGALFLKIDHCDRYTGLRKSAEFGFFTTEFSKAKADLEYAEIRNAWVTEIRRRLAPVAAPSVATAIFDAPAGVVVVNMLTV